MRLSSPSAVLLQFGRGADNVSLPSQLPAMTPDVRGISFWLCRLRAAARRQKVIEVCAISGHGSRINPAWTISVEHYSNLTHQPADASHTSVRSRWTSACSGIRFKEWLCAVRSIGYVPCGAVASGHDQAASSSSKGRSRLRLLRTAHRTAGEINRRPRETDRTAPGRNSAYGV